MANKNDFDPKKEIADLSASVNQPEKIAENWCKAATTQIIIGETLGEIFLKQMKTEPKLQKELKNLIKEVHKENLWMKFQSFFSMFVTAIIFALYELIKVCINKWLG